VAAGSTTGTGDAQINLAQRIPLSGAIVVSTPQDVALLDARRCVCVCVCVRVVPCMCVHVCVGMGVGVGARVRLCVLRVCMRAWEWACRYACELWMNSTLACIRKQTHPVCMPRVHHVHHAYPMRSC